MTRSAAAAVAGCALAVSSCAVHGFKPPTGAPVPAPDGVIAWQQASSTCRSATTFSAQLHVSGSAGGQRLRGTIDGAVTATDQIYMRANAPFGRTAFVLGGDAGHTTLLLPQDNRVVKASAAEIVSALTGLDWSPRDFLDVLSGCVIRGDAMPEVSRIGGHLRLTTADREVYLSRRRGMWQVEGGVLAGLAIGYGDHSGEWPTDVVITSQAGSSNAIAIKIGIEQVATSPLPDTTFVVAVPPDAVPLKLEELRAMFGGKGR